MRRLIALSYLYGKCKLPLAAMLAYLSIKTGNINTPHLVCLICTKRVKTSVYGFTGGLPVCWAGSWPDAVTSWSLMVMTRQEVTVCQT